MHMLAVTIDLSVQDASRLWDAAAGFAEQFAGTTAADIEDMIGHRDAPDVEQCVALLADPRRWPGCTVEDLTIRERSIDVASEAAVTPGVLPAAVQPIVGKGATGLTGARRTAQADRAPASFGMTSRSTG